jgi:hypothetical protein
MTCALSPESVCNSYEVDADSQPSFGLALGDPLIVVAAAFWGMERHGLGLL